MQKIIKTERIAETKFIRLVEDTYIDVHGQEKTWVQVERVNGQHAVVIVPTYKGNLIITKEYRVPLRGYEWGFAAGLIDPGEDPVTAAVRELKEETGFMADKILEVSPLIFNSPGITSEGVYMVYVDVIKEGTPNNLQDSEDITTYIMQREGIANLLSDKSKLFGAKAWLIFKQFVKTGEVI